MRLVAAFVLCLLSLAPLSIQSRQAGATAIPRCDGRPATQFLLAPGTLNGTSGSDVLVGTNGNDVINGKGGNDTICALEGDDTVSGGTGRDYILAGSGADVVDGNAGNDTIYGGGTFYALCSEDVGGDDVLSGSTGNDHLFDACGANRVIGGAGDDVVQASGVGDGRAGDDVVGVFFDGSADHGGSGSDSLLEQSISAVTMNGGSGTDFCDDFGGNDTVVSCES